MQLTYRLNRPRSERGAVAPIVAILMATGVVTGLLALTADVGNIHWERRQVQNGADSAAMALAALCASDPARCNPTTDGPELDPLLNGNAADGLTQFDASRTGTVNGQCGVGTTNPAMPGCPDPGSYENLADCPPLPADWNTKIPFVEAYTRTEVEGGGTILPKFFSQTLTGNTDASVTACARAAWGPPGTYSDTVPITISLCEWKDATADGSRYAPPPGPGGYGTGASQTPWPDATYHQTLYLKAKTDGDVGCPTGPVSKDAPGDFGFLETTVGCSAEVTNGGWVLSDPGGSVPNTCKPSLAGMLNTVISVPIFDCINKEKVAMPYPPCEDDGVGEKAAGKSWYHLAGWARFYISGYRVPSEAGPAGFTGCSSSEVCMTGWFVSGVLEPTDTSTIDPDAPSFGAVLVQLAG